MLNDPSIKEGISNLKSLSAKESIRYSRVNNFKTHYIQLWFLSKSDSAILLLKTKKKISDLNSFNPRKNDVNLHVIDQSKVSRVPLWIDHAPLF